ncbi:MAG: hypothetical protein ACOC0N_02485 [Chroococcales cyanobacterium]
MGKKDIKQVNDIATKFGMTEEDRFEFGQFLEDEKKSGNRGSKNDRGDFTYAELEQKAREFLGL